MGKFDVNGTSFQGIFSFSFRFVSFTQSLQMRLQLFSLGFIHLRIFRKTHLWKPHNFNRHIVWYCRKSVASESILLHEKK